jgi:transcriptional regulator with XRE-family HTH domain
LFVAHSPLRVVDVVCIILSGGVIVITESFGHRIKQLRLSHGMSQDRFSAAIGLDRSYYASVELGKRNISLLNIKKIADGFGVSLSVLFDEVK